MIFMIWYSQPILKVFGIEFDDFQDDPHPETFVLYFNRKHFLFFILLLDLQSLVDRFQETSKNKYLLNIHHTCQDYFLHFARGKSMLELRVLAQFTYH